MVAFTSPLQQAQRLRHRPASPCTILAAMTREEPAQSAFHPLLGLHPTRRIIRCGISKRGRQGRDAVDATLGPPSRLGLARLNTECTDTGTWFLGTMGCSCSPFLWRLQAGDPTRAAQSAIRPPALEQPVSLAPTFQALLALVRPGPSGESRQVGMELFAGRVLLLRSRRSQQRRVEGPRKAHAPHRPQGSTGTRAPSQMPGRWPASGCDGSCVLQRESL